MQQLKTLRNAAIQSLLLWVRRAWLKPVLDNPIVANPAAEFSRVGQALAFGAVAIVTLIGFAVLLFAVLAFLIDHSIL